MIQTAKGRLNDVQAMISANLVSVSLTVLKMMANGVIMQTGGIIRLPIIILKKLRITGDWYFPNP
jgi:hypothetical protein